MIRNVGFIPSGNYIRAADVLACVNVETREVLVAAGGGGAGIASELLSSKRTKAHPEETDAFIFALRVGVPPSLFLGQFCCKLSVLC